MHATHVALILNPRTHTHTPAGAPRLYHVGPSTIPGAGLGVFASQDLPPGSVWNPEDVRPESTVTLTRAQWQTLLNTLDIVEAAGG